MGNICTKTKNRNEVIIVGKKNMSHFKKWVITSGNLIHIIRYEDLLQQIIDQQINKRAYEFLIPRNVLYISPTTLKV